MFDEEPGGARLDRLAGVRSQECVQRHTVEHIVDSAPVVPSLDAIVPLMAEQLVDVFSFVAKYEKEMDMIEDLILVGSLVSIADREAGRRWVNRSSSSLGSNMKKKEEWEEETAEHGSSGWRRSPTCSRRSCCRKLWTFRSCSPSTSWGSSSSWTRDWPWGAIVVCQRHRSWRF